MKYELDQLWTQLQDTDPRFTKRFDKGNFQGTAVDATYNLARVVALLGPAGKTWGWNVIEQRTETLGLGEEAQTIHSLLLRAWFLQENGETRTLDAIGTTKFAYWARPKKPGEKPRYIVDDEAPKKSLTDGLSKIMLALGASADIWTGTFDANKYIRSPEGNGADHAEAAAPPADKKLIDRGRDILAEIRKAESRDDVLEAARKVKGTFNDQPFWPNLVSADRDLAAEIQKLVRSKAKALELDLTKV